jgi:hypothetical protein
MHPLEISAVFRPLERLDSVDTDSNRPQNDVLSLDGAHIGEPRKIMKHVLIGGS